MKSCFAPKNLNPFPSHHKIMTHKTEIIFYEHMYYILTFLINSFSRSKFKNALWKVKKRRFRTHHKCYFFHFHETKIFVSKRRPMSSNAAVTSKTFWWWWNFTDKNPDWSRLIQITNNLKLPTSVYRINCTSNFRCFNS